MSDKPDVPRCTGTTAKGTRCQHPAQAGSTRCKRHGFNPGNIGRAPTVLTGELADRIVGLVLEGNYLKTAAEAVGVPEKTVYRWLERADDLEAAALEHAEGESVDVDVYEHVDPSRWVYLDFRQSIKAAQAYAETELLRMVRYPGFGPWQAAMTILERRKPAHWRRRDSRELDVTGEVLARVEDVRPTEETRPAILEILRAAGVHEAAGGEDPPDPTTEEAHDGKD